MASFGLDELVEVLKAAGEPSRLRLLSLLASADLTVSDLTDILGQSQPRISRHLKLLGEAGLVDRYQEGAWAYFRLREDGGAVNLARQLLASAAGDDPTLLRDAARLASVRQQRSKRAQAYFARHAGEWDEMRRLHVAEEEVERCLVDLVGTKPVQALLDLGTGTGRMLLLLKDIYRRAVGVDASRDMLAVARANLDAEGLNRAVVRLGDILNLPLEREDFDLVIVHQVLHFLDHPDQAIAEAARVLRPEGRLLVVDFAPHDLEYLREEHAHLRLGFSHQTMEDWMTRAGLKVERVVDLPSGHEGREALTVSVWLARDPRLLVAEQKDTHSVRSA
ncbi:metalloregulator ArsR/SmtB family transcription factor [Martelella alba]|uniref:Metalloregulator ArsR/SmtB family transcription factor n=1 Tax=Martelella alba TaxID=2590451 RepID=A0A506UDC7_9HYPH|nr:metalloregulator ArsR/SmtB family transcription factor [Martelella alba]TPW29747.1 metalloregulator ArsR/SmtB family transcription factor [Martelella alba]